MHRFFFDFVVFPFVTTEALRRSPVAKAQPRTRSEGAPACTREDLLLPRIGATPSQVHPPGLCRKARHLSAGFSCLGIWGMNIPSPCPIPPSGSASSKYGHQSRRDGADHRPRPVTPTHPLGSLRNRDRDPRRCRHQDVHRRARCALCRAVDRAVPQPKPRRIRLA